MNVLPLVKDKHNIINNAVYEVTLVEYWSSKILCLCKGNVNGIAIHHTLLIVVLDVFLVKHQSLSLEWREKNRNWIFP